MGAKNVAYALQGVNFRLYWETMSLPDHVLVNGVTIPFDHVAGSLGDNQFNVYIGGLGIDPANPDWSISVFLLVAADAFTDPSELGHLNYLGNENSDATHGIFTPSPTTGSPCPGEGFCGAVADGFVLNASNWILDNPGDVSSITLTLQVPAADVDPDLSASKGFAARYGFLAKYGFKKKYGFLKKFGF